LPGKVSYRGVSRASQTDLLRSSPPLEIEKLAAEPTAARRSLTVAELVTLAVAAIVGIVALAALASAHVGHVTLPIIAVASALVVVVVVLMVWRASSRRIAVRRSGCCSVVR
jgi:cytochrome bd-type quinol oxidase subunit 2